MNNCVPNVNNPCKTYPNTDCVVYTHANLPSSGINTNDRLTVILEKIDSKIGQFVQAGVVSFNARTGVVVSQVGDYNTTQITEDSNLYFTNARAIASTLTSYTSGAGIISASDSILSAIQKLNGNIGALVTGVSSFNSRTGSVLPQIGDYTTTIVSEGTNLYYTNARVLAYGDTQWVQLDGSYINPSWIVSLPYSKITGISATLPISYSGGVISISQSGAATNGYLSSTDWNVFNNKQVAGNYITALTGDASASGPGSVGLTLATVNSSPGSYGNSVTIPVLTVNGKGLITSVTEIAIPTSSSTVIGLLTYADWSTFNNKQDFLGYIPEDVANKSISTSLGTSNILYPSQLAVKTYVDNATAGGIILQGDWNANTNSPDITGTTTTGWAWRVSVTGSTNLGGITSWLVNDLAVKTATGWVRIDNSVTVSSVNGYTGAVVLTTTEISQGTNLYFTNAYSLATTLTGYSSGAGTITSSDTILSAIQKLNGNVTVIGTNYVPYTGATADLSIGIHSFFGKSIVVTATATTTAITGDVATGNIFQGSKSSVVKITIDSDGNLQTNGTIMGSISAGSANNFVISNGGQLEYRTAAQVLTDIGGVSKIGTANAIHYYNTSGNFAANSQFTFDSITGIVKIQSSDSTLQLNGDGAGTLPTLLFSKRISSVNIPYYAWMVDSNNQTSDFYLARYNQTTGAFVDYPITVDDANGTIKLANLPSYTSGGTYVVSNSGILSSRTAAQVLSDIGAAPSSSLAGYVPYTGAINNLDMGSLTITTTGIIYGGDGVFNNSINAPVAHQAGVGVYFVISAGGPSGGPLRYRTAAEVFSDISASLPTTYLKLDGSNGPMTGSLDFGAFNITNGGSATFTSFVGALTGNASTATVLATGRTISISGDLSYTSPSFNGSGNITAVGTLASIITAGGPTGSSTVVPVITWDAKGRLTAVTTATIVAGSTTAAVTFNNSGAGASSGITFDGSIARTISYNTIGAASSTATFTLGSTSISLGSTTTTIAGLTSVTSTSFVGTLTGNASTTTILATSRNIQGIAFNGSASIDIINGTGFIKATGTTLSYDNSTYLTTSLAASTYLPLAGGTMSGDINMNSSISITNVGAITFGGASAIYYNVSNGLTITGGTGSLYDFSITTPASAFIMKVPTGTINALFAGSVTAPSFVGTLTGNASTATSFGNVTADFSSAGTPVNMVVQISGGALRVASSATTKTFLGYYTSGDNPTFGTVTGNITGTAAGETLATVTGRGATTATQLNLNGGFIATGSTNILTRLVRNATSNYATVDYYTGATANWSAGTGLGETSSNYIVYNQALGNIALKIGSADNAVTLTGSLTAGAIAGTTVNASGLITSTINTGSFLTAASAGTNPLYETITNTGGVFYVGLDGSTGASFGGGNYAANIWATGAVNMNFGTNNTKRLTIDGSGNVGVGTAIPIGKFVISNGGAAGIEFDPVTGTGGGVDIISYNRSTSTYKPITWTASSYTFNTGVAIFTAAVQSNATETNTVYSGAGTGASFIFTSGYNALRQNTSHVLSLDVYNGGSPLASQTWNQNGSVTFASSVTGGAASFTTGAFSGDISISHSGSSNSTVGISGSTGSYSGVLSLQRGGTEDGTLHAASTNYNPASASAADIVLNVAGGGRNLRLATNNTIALTINSSQAITAANSVTATSFIKTGGTSSQFLMADGSVTNGLTLPNIAKTSTYNITTSDYTINCTSGTFTVTLPTAVGISGQIFVVKNSGTGTITIATTSSQTIDTVTSKTLNTQNSGFAFQSNGANWIIISAF